MYGLSLIWLERPWSAAGCLVDDWMKGPARILVFNGSFVAGREDHEVPFVQELRRRIYLVDFILGAGKTTVGHRGHPRDVRKHGRLSQTKSIRCSQWLSVEFLIARSDLVLIGEFKGTATIAELARRYGKIVVQYDYSVDTSRSRNVDFFAVIGPHFKDALLKLSPEVNARSIFVVGSLRHDRARWSEVQDMTRQRFCKIYEIDPEKKIALFLPTAPWVMDDFYVGLYRRICGAISNDPRFTLMIKGHPSDYMKLKSDRFGETPSWEVLAPHVPVVQQHHGFQSFRHCEVGITTSSSVAFEFALAGRPLLFVETNEVKQSWSETEKRSNALNVPSWVGSETSVEALPDVLGTGGYRICDDGVFERFIAKYCYKNDGLAYKRLADVVDTIVETGVVERNRVSAGYLYAATVCRRLAKRLQDLVSVRRDES